MITKIVGISGAQNSGKTTLLSGLIEHGYLVDDYKVSRAVQTELGLSKLTDITGEADGMCKFQELIVKRKFERDTWLVDQGTVPLVLTERTFADIAGYAESWVKNLKNSSDELHHWLTKYTFQCRQNQQVYDAVIFIPARTEIAFEYDPHRASESTQRDLDFSIMHNSIHFSKKIFVVSSLSVEDRVNEVEKFLKSL